MSKKALLLVIGGGLALFIIGLAGSYFIYNNFLITPGVPKITVPKITNPIFPTLTKSQVAFFLSGVPDTLSASRTFDVNINIASSEDILAVDLDVNYDPTKVAFEKITPGGLFGQPMEFSKNINDKTGKIFYALGALKGSSGSGIVAVVRFRALVNGGEPRISLDNKTNASAKGNQALNIVLTNQ
jgi:hypothetical protein